MDFKDVGVLDSLNPFEPDTPIEEPVRVGLPTYNVNQGPCNKKPEEWYYGSISRTLGQDNIIP